MGPVGAEGVEGLVGVVELDCPPHAVELMSARAIHPITLTLRSLLVVREQG
jgi:hypothetical protein